MSQGPHGAGRLSALSAHAAEELDHLVRFASASRRREGGFGALDTRGRLAAGAPLHPLQTTRMTYSFSIAALLGIPDTEELAAHGVHALRTVLFDSVHGGTFSDPTDLGAPKSAYLACFTALAASAAAHAGVEGARRLLDDAAATLVDRFWSETDGALIDEWDRAFTRPTDYRGANANMHAVEAMNAIGVVLEDPSWHARAARIAELLIDRIARRRGWMLPEHFDATWTPQLDYNRDRLHDEFRPYGVTIGHLLEWSRLLLELHIAQPTDWLPGASRSLYATARRLGWRVDGAPGFIYTVDWNGEPVVRNRPHWVALEAIAAAATQAQALDDRDAAADVVAFQEYSESYLRDRVHGSWHHELDPGNRPVAQMWAGKPDAYHALGAILIPELPLAPSLAGRVLALDDIDHTDRQEQTSWSLA